MNYTIRKADPDDAAELTGLILGLGWFDKYFDGMSVDDARRQVGRHLRQCLADDSHSIYVAVDEAEHLLGYASVHWLPYLFLPSPEGYVSELFLAEAARGQGIGGHLLQVVTEEAAARGCSRLMLLNPRTRESYQRGFYAKQGWEERPDAANFVLKLSRPTD